MDRIDLFVQANPVNIHELTTAKARGKTSAQIRTEVMQARKIQEKRFENQKYAFNSQISSSDVQKYCFLTQETRSYVNRVFETMNLSARAFHKVLRVARTIADLAGKEEIEKEHIAEAICFRNSQNGEDTQHG